MKRISVGFRLAIAGALLLAAAPVIARAQSRSSQGSVSALIGAVSSISAQLAALNAIAGLTTREVQLVNAATILDKSNGPVLNNLFTKRSADITRLQSALGSNTVVMQSLTTANVDLTRVLALDVQPGGNVVVYYR